MPRGYDGKYQRIKAQMAGDQPVSCAHCHRRVATTLDHDPPLAMHVHRPDSGCCHLIPSCEQCNRQGGILVQNGQWRPGIEVTSLEPEPERDGLDQKDKRWRVPWLKPLLRVPEDAVWPRLMTVPHPRAVDSLGPEFCQWAEQRSGKPLRWWQQLAAYRLLEVDSNDDLVWQELVLSTARQVGKSWLLRELCLWRLHQGDRFAEAQDILHTGKDLAVCKEVQRVARVWAKARTDLYKVREVNGQEEIEFLEDGSRWMLRAKEATYGYSVSLAVVDEAWRVRSSSVDEGLTPTMSEREQAQLLLVSTAHRKATSLMLSRRQVALAQLEAPEGELLIEWSAPAGVELDDRTAWRLASPSWSPRRERLIASRYQAMEAGEIEDPEEPDPRESFACQWLNRWPRKLSEPAGATEALLPAGTWEGLAATELEADGAIWIGLEDDYGLGAAVAVARRLGDGRVEVDGWLRADWDSAMADVEGLAAAYSVRRILVGASMLDRVPSSLRRLSEPRAGTNTRTGLALLRDLALSGLVVHDATTTDLDQALALATVREAPTGLFLLSKGPTHLVRATVWALAEAHKRAAMPAIR